MANGVKENSLQKGGWILICSGALVNERTVVVAAHCVTDLGKIIVLKTAELKVVLGKFYRDDDRDEKTIQNLRVSLVGAENDEQRQMLITSVLYREKKLNLYCFTHCYLKCVSKDPTDRTVVAQGGHMPYVVYEIPLSLSNSYVHPLTQITKKTAQVP